MDHVENAEWEGEQDCEVEEEEADDGLDAPLHGGVDGRGAWVAKNASNNRPKMYPKNVPHSKT